MLRQIRPSVCLSVRPSDTLRYCVKTTKRRRIRYSPSGSPVSLVFLVPRMVDVDPVGVKFNCKKSIPCIGLHISPHSSGIVIDSEESSIKARKSTIGFSASHQPRSMSPLTSPKLVQIHKFAIFR